MRGAGPSAFAGGSSATAAPTEACLPSTEPHVKTRECQHPPYFFSGRLTASQLLKSGHQVAGDRTGLAVADGAAVELDHGDDFSRGAG